MRIDKQPPDLPSHKLLTNTGTPARFYLDCTPPSQYPTIEWAEISPLPYNEKILKSVHAINRYAKQFDEKADTAYQINEGANARVYSLRKKALYKTVAVHRLVKKNPEQTRVTLHNLNGTNEMHSFLLFDISSFHQPIAAIDDALWENSTLQKPQEAKEIDFQPSTNTRSLSLSLEAALHALAEHGINANDYLDTKSVLIYDWKHQISITLKCMM